MSSNNENAFPGVHMNYADQLEKQMHEQIETASAAANAAQGDVNDRIEAALRNVYDPEIPVNIYDLGLIYNFDMDDEKVVHIEMTLTTPGCPVAQSFPAMVEAVVRHVDGVEDAQVNLVWDPPWEKDMMTEAAMLQLGFL